MILNYLSQREELELTRQELSETRKEFKEQNITLKIEKFENTFFNLINYLDEIVDSISLHPNTLEGTFKAAGYNNIIGLDCFSGLVSDLRIFFSEPNNVLEDDINYVKQVYNRFAKKHTYLLNHYYRYIKFIINFVDKSDFIDFENKKFYVRMLIVQFSNYELLILYYMGLSEYGEHQGYKELFEKYEFFKGIYLNAVFKDDHKLFYSHLQSED